MRKCLELWNKIKFLHAYQHQEFWYFFFVVVPLSFFIIFDCSASICFIGCIFIGFYIWVLRQHLGMWKALWVITFRYYGNRLSITSRALNLKILPTLKSTWKLNIWAGIEVYFRFKLINCWFWMIKIGIIDVKQPKHIN